MALNVRDRSLNTDRGVMEEKLNFYIIFFWPPSIPTNFFRTPLINLKNFEDPPPHPLRNTRHIIKEVNNLTSKLLSINSFWNVCYGDIDLKRKIITKTNVKGKSKSYWFISPNLYHIQPPSVPTRQISSYFIQSDDSSNISSLNSQSDNTLHGEHSDESISSTESESNITE